MLYRVVSSTQTFVRIFTFILYLILDGIKLLTSSRVLRHIITTKCGKLKD